LLNVAVSDDGEFEFQEFTTVLMYLTGVASKFKESDADKSNSLSMFVSSLLGMPFIDLVQASSEIHAVLRSLGVFLTVAEVDVAIKRSGKTSLDFPALIALLDDIRLNLDKIKKRMSPWY